MSPLANEQLQIYWKLLGIIIVAFALRVAVRCYSGSADFWANGYTFYFDVAQNIAAGKGISFGTVPLMRVVSHCIRRFLRQSRLVKSYFFPSYLLNRWSARERWCAPP